MGTLALVFLVLVVVVYVWFIILCIGTWQDAERKLEELQKREREVFREVFRK